MEDVKQTEPEQQELDLVSELEKVALLPVSETPLTDMISKVELSPEELLDHQITIVRQKQKFLMESIEATLTGLLNLLTSSGVDQMKRERIKKAIKVGVLSGLDYGIDVMKINMTQKGVFARYEGFLGSTVARARENGMVLIAHNFKKEEDAKNKVTEQTGGIDEQKINQESSEINDQGTQSVEVSSDQNSNQT